MDKKARLTLLATAALIGVVVLAWVWWPPSASKVDPAIVQAASESARKAAERQPAPPDDPAAPRGRARPGSLGGPTP